MPRVSETGTAQPVFESTLLSSLSALVNRLDSFSFQSTHASRLENGLGFSANKVLYVLGSSGPARPSALAAQLATGRANVSKVVRLLEHEGLVARTPDPGDSRAYLLALTPTGEQRASEIFRIGEQMLQEVTASWSEVEVAAFTGLMARFTEGVAAYERGLAARPGGRGADPTEETA
jgi:DNA-binding MarR family transcriptional regulator